MRAIHAGLGAHFLVAALIFFAPIRAHAQSPSMPPLDAAGVREGVLAIVSLRHPPDGDKDKKKWLSLGPAAPRVIASLIRTEERLYYRVRMVEGLQYFDSAEAKEAVRNLLATTDEPILKQASLGTLGRWADPQDLNLIAGYLNDPKQGTRAAAQAGLKQMAQRSRDIQVLQKTSEIQRDLPAKMTGGPIAVSSSDQNPSPDFSGIWRGVWIAPKTGVDRAVHESAALIATPAEAQFSLENGSLSARGKLAMPNSTALTLAFERIQSVPGQSQRITGFVRRGPAAAESFDAELVRQGGEFGLILRILSAQITWIARHP